MKKLLKRFEAWLLSKDSNYARITNAVTYITGRLRINELHFYTNYIEKKLNSSDLTDDEKATIRPVVMAALRQCVQQYSYSTSHERSSTRSIINIVFEAMRIIYHEVGTIAGVQPMSTPVSQLFLLKYKQPDADSEKISLEIVAHAIEARSRILQAGLPMERTQDMMSVHGIDVLPEIEKAVAAEIAYEIFSAILNEIIEKAKTINCDLALDYASETFVSDVKRLKTEIIYTTNDIGRETMRGCGNFIIASPMVIATLQCLPDSTFKSAASEVITYKNGRSLSLVGMLNDTIKVYCSVNIGNKILVGYKGGNGQCDTGYVFAPYVLCMKSGLVVDPVSFQPIQTLMTRYGSLYDNPSYYKVIELRKVVGL